MHEAATHNANCYITLTYDEQHLPADHCLKLEHYQAFIKSLRKKLAKTNTNIRYYHCGEYGDRSLRPHYHAILFGYDFTADKKHLTTRHDTPVYTSQLLAETWPYGLHEITTLTLRAARYVAKYVAKAHADIKTEFVDKTTGEVFDLTPEYSTMSRRPGLGSEFFHRYRSIFTRDTYTVLDGLKLATPRYYDRLLDQVDPEALEDIQHRRAASIKHRKGTTQERKDQQERAIQAKLKSKKGAF